MSKISELSDGGSLQSTDYLIAVRSGGNVKVRPNGAVSGTTGQFSTSLNVDGTVTADGLTVDGSATFNTSSTLLANLNYSSSNIGKLSTDGINFNIEATSNLYAKVNSATRLLLDGNGDISFFEDTGTTPKFFWDASAEALFIGATSAAALNSYSDDLVISNTVFGTGAGISIVSNATSGYSNIHFGDTDDADIGRIQYNNADNKMTFRTNASDAVVIDSAGNVGIGTTNTEYNLTIYDDDVTDGSTKVAIGIGSTENGSTAKHAAIGYAKDSNAAGSLLLYTKTAGGITEKARITSAGNVGIGTSSPNAPLHIANATPVIRLEDTSASVSHYINSNNAELRIQSGGALSLRTAVGEAARIDTLGNLLVGKTAANFTVAGHEIKPGGFAGFTRDGGAPIVATRLTSDGDIIELYKDGTSVGSIASVGSSDIKVVFSSDGDQYITGNAASNYLSFSSANAERMRIDSSGNWMLGKTASNSATQGVEARPAGQLFSTGSGATLYLNRLTTDGDIAVFRKDGTAVGSIGANGGDLFVGTGDTNILFADGSDTLVPATTGGATRDAAINLGSFGARFKDLYLSGGVYLGGTGAANLLDDYEEGTWTGKVADAASAGNESSTTVYGYYVKIGELVYVHFNVSNINTTGMTAGNNVYITGLPFTSKSVTGNAKYTGTAHMSVVTFEQTPILNLNESSTAITIAEVRSGAGIDFVVVSQLSSGASDIHGNLCYQTD